MYKQYLFLFEFAAIVYLSYCVTPPYLKKCKAEDTKCITDTTNVIIPIFADGLPEYNVETLDPLIINNINASQGNLLYNVSNATIDGLKNCEAIKIVRDKNNFQMSLKIICSVTLECQYFIKGSVLLFPIHGSGKSRAELRAIELDIVMNIIDEAMEDRKSHWQITTWSHTFDLKEKSRLAFDGLFEDNEVLKMTAEALMAKFSNDIIKEIAPKFLEAIIERVIVNINNFFRAVPSEDLGFD